jgi:hypothetical protein
MLGMRHLISIKNPICILNLINTPNFTRTFNKLSHNKNIIKLAVIRAILNFKREVHKNNRMNNLIILDMMNTIIMIIKNMHQRNIKVRLITT